MAVHPGIGGPAAGAKVAARRDDSAARNASRSAGAMTIGRGWPVASTRTAERPQEVASHTAPSRSNVKAPTQ